MTATALQGLVRGVIVDDLQTCCWRLHSRAGAGLECYKQTYLSVTFFEDLKAILLERRSGSLQIPAQKSCGRPASAKP